LSNILFSWFYKRPSTWNGYGLKRLRYFVLKDNLLLYSSQRENPAIVELTSGSVRQSIIDQNEEEETLSKGIVITGDTTVEEKKNLFQDYVKIHSSFSNKTLYLRFLSEEQQEYWVEAIQRAIHLQRTSKSFFLLQFLYCSIITLIERESISMTIKQYYYPESVDDYLIAVDLKSMKGWDVRVALFQNLQEKKTTFLNLSWFGQEYNNIQVCLVLYSRFCSSKPLLSVRSLALDVNYLI
jgi:hypothetical protein